MKANGRILTVAELYLILSAIHKSRKTEFLG